MIASVLSRLKESLNENGENDAQDEAQQQSVIVLANWSLASEYSILGTAEPKCRKCRVLGKLLKPLHVTHQNVHHM